MPTGAVGEADSRDVDWSPEEVAQNIFRIPLPLPDIGLRSVNVYAITDGVSIWLIDGGWAFPPAFAALQTGLQNVGLDVRGVERVLVTHMHGDHYTQAVSLRRVLGAEITLGREEQRSVAVARQFREGIESPYSRQVHLHGAKHLAARMRHHLDSDQQIWAFYEDPDRWVDHGDTFGFSDVEIEAVATPGHTRGHVAFRVADRDLMFSGDHVLPRITPSIGFEPSRAETPLKDYLSSLARLLRLPDARMMPAHGAVGPSIHERARELLAHHSTRLDAAHQALTIGADTAAEVARILPWTSRQKALDELNDFNQMLAILETAAHLDVLVVSGKAWRGGDEEEGFTYAATDFTKVDPVAEE